MSLERFEFDVNDVIPANLCNILTLLFCIFLWILERTFALCNAIPANEHTQFANGGLRVNPWNFWLMQFCFTIKKNHFKPKLLLWPQVSCTNNWHVTRVYSSQAFKYFQEHHKRKTLSNFLKSITYSLDSPCVLNISFHCVSKLWHWTRAAWLP